MARVDGNEAGGKNRVFTQLAFDCQVALRCVGIFEVLRNMQRERQDGTKAGKRARIKALKAGQVMGAGRQTRRDSRNRRAMEYLERVEESSR